MNKDSARENSELAGRGARFVATIIDSLICAVLLIPFGYFIAADRIRAGEGPTFAFTAAMTVVGYLWFAGVNGYFLHRNGQTIGKKLLSIRIARLDGGVPSLGAVLGLRTLPLWVIRLAGPLSMLIVVDLLFIFRSDKRCLHDIVAGTKVVRA